MGTRRKLVILGVFMIGLVGLGSWLGRQIFARPLVDSEHIIFTPGEPYRLATVVENPLVVVADSVTLDGGSQITGDSAFIGSAVMLAPEAAIHGDITLLGDSVTLNGQITGHASVIANSVRVGGQITGDLTVVSDSLEVSEDAVIDGKVVACVDVMTGGANLEMTPCGDAEAFNAVNTGLKFDQALWGAGFSTLALVVSGFTSLVLSGVGALAVAAFPRQFSYIEEAILTGPRRVAKTGFLVFLLAIGATVGLLVALAAVPPLGIVLLPVFVIAAIVLLGMTMTGWVTVALIIGNWLLRRSTRAIVPPLIAAVVGSVVLFLLWHAVSLVPFGILAVLLAMAVLGSIGLGAALRTRMGTRSVRRRYFVQG